MKPYLGLHISVALFGLAGLFGRWLPFDPILIVWARVFFACLAFIPFILVAKRPWTILLDRKFVYSSFLLGLVLALHWYSFFRSIQETSIALALLSFASFPFFTLLLELALKAVQFRSRDLGLVLLSLLGTSLIVPWDSQSPDLNGVLWGLFSGFSFALLAILNKRLVSKYHSIQISFFQDLWACLILLPFSFEMISLPNLEDWALLFLLGSLFTALSHALFIESLKTIPARTAALIAALEPVYGILAAYFLFAEAPSLLTLLGGSLILGAGLMAQRGEV